jgi:WD40 repeat protein
MTSRFRRVKGPIYSAVCFDKSSAFGTDDGLVLVNSDDEIIRAHYRERTVATAFAPWGARGAIITGSSDGTVRRWTFAQELSQYSSESYEKVGSRLKCLIVSRSEIIAATSKELVILDEDVRTKRTIPISFDIAAMEMVGESSLLICGPGSIAHVSLAKGISTRLITASNEADYCCVAARDANTFYIGTSDGKLSVLDLASGEELATINVGFNLRGVAPLNQKVLAYGGEWTRKDRKDRSIALVIAADVKRPLESL